MATIAKAKKAATVQNFKQPPNQKKKMQALEDSLKYQQWKSTLSENGVTVSRMEELHSIRKPNGELLFSMVKMDATAADGQKLLPVALLRGHFVSVLIVFIDKDTQARYVLLVKQYRVANGAICYEFAAGMCDSESDPLAVAVKEVKEETGFEVQREQLHAMNQQMIFSSPGLLDEGGYLYWCEIELTHAEMQAFHDKTAGAAGEQEFIQTEVVPIGKVLGLVNSMTSIAQILMYARERGVVV